MEGKNLWCSLDISPGKTVIAVLHPEAFLFILLGGVSYSIGAVLYAIAGRKVHRYMHSVFHIFVVIGSLLQYLGILFYVL